MIQASRARRHLASPLSRAVVGRDRRRREQNCENVQDVSGAHRSHSGQACEAASSVGARTWKDLNEPGRASRHALSALSLQECGFVFSHLSESRADGREPLAHDRSSGHMARTSGYTAIHSLSDREAKRPTNDSTLRRTPARNGRRAVGARRRADPAFRTPAVGAAAGHSATRPGSARSRCRARPREARPQPVKWLAIFALACIPVLLTIVAVDGFLRVFHKVAACIVRPTQQERRRPRHRVELQPRHRDPAVLRNAVRYAAQRLGARDEPAAGQDRRRAR